MALEGDMSIYSAAALKDRLLDAVKTTADLELDLSQVSEFDSAGLQVLYLAKREAAQAGHNLRIVAHSTSVRELLDLYNLVAFFGDPMLIPARDDR